jgi:hypothetical protein
MGFIGDLFSSSKGAGFQAQGTNIMGLTDPNQIGRAGDTTQGAISQQQQFVNALNAQTPGALNAQGGLLQMLQQQAAGGGPNPAAAQLAQSTGQNVANQAALMAGQRGAGVNPGMMARQIANQGANIQQQAAGQAATQQAQQQLAAQQALGALSGQMVGQQQSGLGQLGQMSLGQQQALLGAGAAQNNANVSMQSNINSANANVAAGNQKNQGNVLGGVLSGIGSVFGLAEGGVVPAYDEGGKVGPISKFAQIFAGQNGSENADPIYQGMSSLVGGLGNKILGTGTNAAPVSLGANFGMPQQDMGLTNIDLGLKPMAMQVGGYVPGEASVEGDSAQNDTVVAKLSPGEVVIPRSKVKDPQKVAAFVNAILGMNLKSGSK